MSEDIKAGIEQLARVAGYAIGQNASIGAGVETSLHLQIRILAKLEGRDLEELRQEVDAMVSERRAELVEEYKRSGNQRSD